MNGPVEYLKKLPCLDEKYYPQVTFLELRDEWMKKTGKYKCLYEMDTDIAYDCLRVWVDVNNPSFQNCIIDTSDNVCDGLNHVAEKIIEEAITTTDPDIMLSQTVLLCTISNDCMAPCWGPRGAYVMSYQANEILKT